MGMEVLEEEMTKTGTMMNNSDNQQYYYNCHHQRETYFIFLFLDYTNPPILV